MWLLGFGAHSNARDGDIGDAASQGSNLIGWSAQCFGAGGKNYTNNRTVVIGEKYTAALLIHGA